MFIVAGGGCDPLQRPFGKDKSIKLAGFVPTGINTHTHTLLSNITGLSTDFLFSYRLGLG